MLVTVLFTISAKTSRHSLCRRSAGAVVEVGGADRRRFLYVDSPRTSLTRFLTSPATSPRDRLTRHNIASGVLSCFSRVVGMSSAAGALTQTL